MLVRPLIRTRTQPNYELKAKVIENGCARIQRKLSLAKWKRYQAICLYEETGEISEALEKNELLIESYSTDLENYSFEEIKEAERVNNASYHRVKRLSDRVYDMINNSNAIFLTLTFRDDVLANTSEETRKKYIQRFLKESCISYVANIDYGAKNNREHYHAVVIPKGDRIDSALYLYGSIDMKRVRNKKSDDNEATSKRLAKYVAKLTNHAIKHTTRKNRIIYSRG